VVLIRSMTKRLRNVPESFDPPEEPPTSDAPDAEDPPGTRGASGEAGPARERSSPDG
jgi:hypothetical protein